MTANRALALAILFVAVGRPCQAGTPYELHSTREWILLGGGAALSGAAVAIVENVEPLTLEEIEQLNPDNINSFDRKAIAPYRDTEAGNGLMYASYVFPLTLLAYPDAKRDWKTLGVIWGEVTLINLGLNGVVKGLVLRTRPYVYEQDTPQELKTEVKARLSFYSGHTSSAAANCFFVAKVCNDYFTSKKVKALIWTGAAIYPALVGYLRRDSGHHFRTDVITGYCLGAMTGYVVPWLHRNRDAKGVSLYPAAVLDGAGVGILIGF